METCIVSFVAGTSGRFISNIIYQLLIDSTDKLTWSDEGSAHSNNMFMSSWNLQNCVVTTDENLLFNTNDFYENFMFDSTGVAYSHLFPNFDLLRRRLPDTKIVIISFSLDDKIEISFNNAIKNLSFGENQFTKIFKNKFGLDANDNLDLFIDFTIDQMVKTSVKFKNSKFTDPIIPEDFKDKTLIIQYQDLYKITDTGSYKAFDQIKHFLNNEGNDVIFENYKAYVDKRNALVNNYIPLPAGAGVPMPASVGCGT